MKRRPTSLIIREKQIKAMMSYHLLEWLLLKRHEITSVEEDVEEMETLYHVG